MSAGGSTVAGLTASPSPTAVWGRRLGIGLLATVVLADLTTVLGVHDTEGTVTGGGYRLSLTYPSLARAGLDVPWRVTVEHPGGFTQPVRLALTGDYLTIFETQGFHPEPAATTRTADRLILTFDPPDGDTFVLDYDAYVQPAAERGRSGVLQLLVDSRPVASLAFATHLWP
jgi:hypothetical protein